MSLKSVAFSGQFSPEFWNGEQSADDLRRFACLIKSRITGVAISSSAQRIRQASGNLSRIAGCYWRQVARVECDSVDSMTGCFIRSLRRLRILPRCR